MTAPRQTLRPLIATNNTHPVKQSGFIPIRDPMPESMKGDSTLLSSTEMDKEDSQEKRRPASTTRPTRITSPNEPVSPLAFRKTPPTPCSLRRWAYRACRAYYLPKHSRLKYHGFKSEPKTGTSWRGASHRRSHHHGVPHRGIPHQANIVVSAGRTFSLSEGDRKPFSVRLNSDPQKNEMRVSLSNANPDVSFTPNSMTFTPSN